MRRTLLLLFVSNVTIKGPFDMFIYCPRFPIKWQHSILEFPGSCSGSMPIKLIRINHSMDTIFSALFACALLPIPWKRVGHRIMERTAGSAFSSFLYHSLSLCVSNPTVPLLFLFLHRCSYVYLCPFIILSWIRNSEICNCANSVMIYLSSDLSEEIRLCLRSPYLSHWIGIFPVYQDGVLVFVSQIGALFQNQNTTGLKLFSLPISKKREKLNPNRKSH